MNFPQFHAVFPWTRLVVLFLFLLLRPSLLLHGRDFHSFYFYGLWFSISISLPVVCSLRNSSVRRGYSTAILGGCLVFLFALMIWTCRIHPIGHGPRRRRYTPRYHSSCQSLTVNSIHCSRRSSRKRAFPPAVSFA